MATSGQYGDTGLLSQTTAQTLNEGNICVGLWANCSDKVTGDGTSSGSSALIIPTTITMGLGTFMEAYGSYPNLLFNGDGDASGRGFANAGFKFRVLGKRSDEFRLAVDLHGRLSVSDNPDLDGLTDYATRFIATLKKDTFAVHANAGFLLNDSPATVSYDDQIMLGGGVEYSLATRLRLIAEFSMQTEKVAGLGAPTEVTAGLQYYITPHLTLNLGASMGLTDASPAWRIIAGLTTCQGVGTFNRPVPKLIEPEALVDEPEKPAKVIKIKLLTSLLSKSVVADSPVSHLEVPLTSPDQAIVVNPTDRLQFPVIKSLSASPLGAINASSSRVEPDLPEQPFAAKVRRIFRFPELSFAFNQWDLSDEGRASISLVAEELRKENKYFIISIEGHTDDVGSEAYNQSLSFKRAVAAATHIVLRDGFDPARIFVKGFGESRPIDDNAKDQGRARNRRVEFLILVPEGYENIEVEVPEKSATLQGSDNAMLPIGPVIDPLAIEQVIMEKTGAETAKPAGAFSQIEQGR